MSTAKRLFQRLVFNPANHNSTGFLDELQKLANYVFRIAVHAFIEQFKYAKKLSHLEKSVIQVHLENGTFEQIVTHLEKELGLNSLETLEELQKKTVAQNATKPNPETSRPMCHYC